MQLLPLRPPPGSDFLSLAPIVLRHVKPTPTVYSENSDIMNIALTLSFENLIFEFPLL